MASAMPFQAILERYDQFQVSFRRNELQIDSRAIDERERLRVFCEHGRERAGNGHNEGCSAVIRPGTDLDYNRRYVNDLPVSSPHASDRMAL